AGFLPDKEGEPTKGMVGVWDTATTKPLKQWPRTDNETDRCSIAFSPRSDFLFSLSTTGLLRIEEIATGLEILNHKFARDVGGDIAVSADGAMVAVSTGPNSRKLFIWKWQSPEEPREIKVQDRVPRNMAFSPDGKILAGAGDIDRTIHV